MCEFCKPEEVGDGVCNEIGFTEVAMGNADGLFGLQALLTNDKMGDNPEMKLVLFATNGGADIANINIPIRYCPVCGRKL